MGSLAEQYRPAAIEKAARALWAARGFPRPDGVVGRSVTPLLRQFEGAYASGDDPALVTFRAVAADVDARYLALSGRRALGTLRREAEPGDDPVGPLLRALSIWTGGEGGQPYDVGERRAPIETILGRMAARGLVVTRDAPLRICPNCSAPRSPERIVYQQEEGDTYLVRFGIADGDRRVQAIVWVDAPWRLLGATALLVHPDMTYVVARYRRKGVDELILTSRSSLARLVQWLPGAEVEVVDEGPGSRWAGRPYDYPLRAEFPMGAELPAPGGTVQAVGDVGDSGTGIVPLVPGHGGTDAQIAERIGVTGWPLVTPRGQLATTLMHKYAGLDLPTGSEFVLRDLGDSGALFAHLRVRRGVPHCAICGTPLVWAPGRAWCLEPGRLPPERATTYRRLLPREPPMAQIEVAAWPVSESTAESPGPGNATLLECLQCERLEPLGADPTCVCGGTRRAVSRRILPAIHGILGAWARFDPFPPGDSVWIYLNERRRAPALAHHLAVMTGVAGAPADVSVTLLPGGGGAPLASLVERDGADAVRAALVRGEVTRTSGPALPDACAQEARLLGQYWHLARGVLQQIEPALLTAFLPSIAGFLSELEPEDRAILARWERVRVAVLADYDAQAPGRAFRRLARFISNDLPRYRALVAPRLDPNLAIAGRRGALRTLHHLIRSSSLLLAPVAPHTAELVYGATTTAGTSIFEAALDPVDANLLDDERAKAWDRWRTVLDAVDRFRISLGIPARKPLPAVVAVVPAEELAQSLRNDQPVLERLADLGRFDAFGPATPWNGRRRDLEPVLAEIQKVYPSEATQIVHILRRQPSHRRADSAAGEDLQVVLQGTPRRILPSMVAYVERIPDRTIPWSWGLGEMYVELPPDFPVPPRIPPPLSPDAFRLVRRVQQEIRQRLGPAGSGRPPLVIATLDPLASELRRVAPELAQYLEVPEVRVIDDHLEFPLSESFQGRTRTGVRWWLYLPGLAPSAPRTKARRPRASGSRVHAPRPPTASTEPEIDYASPDYVAREEQVRALMQEMDGVLGAPLLGFAKTAGAWDAGLHSRADFESAGFDTVAALPGFGWSVAGALAEKFGKPIPPRPISPTASPAGGAELDAAGDGASRADMAGADVARRGPSTADDFGTDASSGGAPYPEDDWNEPHRDARRGRRRDPARTAPLPPPPAPVVQPVVVPPRTPLIRSDPAPSAEPGLVPEGTSAPTPVETLRKPESPATVAPPAPATSAELPPPPETPLVPAEPVREPQDEAASSSPAPMLPAPEPSEEGGDASPPSDGPPPSLEPELATEPAEPQSVEPSRPDPELPPFASPLDVPADAPTGEGTSVSDLGELSDAHPEEAGPEPPADPAPAPAELPTSGLEQTPPVGGEEPGMGRTSELVETPAPTPEEPIAPPESELSMPSPPVESPPGEDVQPPLPAPDVPRVEGAETAAAIPALEPPSGVAEETAPPASSAPEPGPPTSAPEVVFGAPSPEPAPALASPELEAAGGMPPVAEPTLPDLPESTPPPTPTAQPEGSEAAPAPAADAHAIEGAPAVPAPSEPSPAPPVEVPMPPVAPMVAPSPPAPPTGVEIVVAPSYLPALREFLDMTAAGHRGIAIVRESPERLRTHVGHRPAEVYWLTNLGRGLTLKPNDLEGYRAFLESAVDRDRVTAFFLEGIEYLVRLHGIDRMVETLTDLHTRARAHDARVWVCIHPNLIAAGDLDRLVGAFPA